MQEIKGKEKFLKEGREQEKSDLTYLYRKRDENYIGLLFTDCIKKRRLG